MKLSQLDTPVLLIEEDAFLRNMKHMQELAVEANIAYRPHAKAHKSAEIAKMQIKHGAIGICVATLYEAEVMSKNNIENILITTPITNLNSEMDYYTLKKKLPHNVVPAYDGLSFLI